MTASAIRSLKLPVGFSHSSFTKRAPPLDGATLPSRTIEVLPMASSTLMSSGEIRGRNPPLRRLLERVGKADERRLAACHAREAHAVRGRFRFERLRKRGGGRIRNQTEWNDHSRIAWFCRDGRSEAAWKNQGIEVVFLHHFIDAVRAGQIN